MYWICLFIAARYWSDIHKHAEHRLYPRLVWMRRIAQMIRRQLIRPRRMIEHTLAMTKLLERRVAVVCSRTRRSYPACDAMNAMNAMNASVMSHVRSEAVYISTSVHQCTSVHQYIAERLHGSGSVKPEQASGYPLMYGCCSAADTNSTVPGTYRMAGGS